MAAAEQSTVVLVVGGGPAGSAAAIHAAQQGLDVVLVEAAEFPRHHAGEALHPGTSALFRTLGVLDEVEAAGFLRNEGVWVARQQCCEFQPFGPAGQRWWGYQAWRAQLDHLLLERARVVGVRILQPARGRQLLQDEGRVTGAVTSAGEVPARFVLDATGALRWVSRQLSHVPWNRHSRRLLVQYGYAAGELAADTRAPLFTWTGGSWLWTAQVQPHLYQWTRLLEPQECFVPSWLPEQFRGLQPMGRAQAADATWMSASTFCGPGYFLLGDAAGTLDPSASHGVLRALMSGMMAAHLITKAVHHGISETAMCQTYNDWLGQWFRHDRELLNSLYFQSGSSPLA